MPFTRCGLTGVSRKWLNPAMRRRLALALVATMLLAVSRPPAAQAGGHGGYVAVGIAIAAYQWVWIPNPPSPPPPPRPVSQ
jgi:hypothetical protein